MGKNKKRQPPPLPRVVMKGVRPETPPNQAKGYYYIEPPSDYSEDSDQENIRKPKNAKKSTKLRPVQATNKAKQSGSSSAPSSKTKPPVPAPQASLKAKKAGSNRNHNSAEQLNETHKSGSSSAPSSKTKPPVPAPRASLKAKKAGSNRNHNSAEQLNETHKSGSSSAPSSKTMPPVPAPRASLKAKNAGLNGLDWSQDSAKPLNKTHEFAVQYGPGDHPQLYVEVANRVGESTPYFWMESTDDVCREVITRNNVLLYHSHILPSTREGLGFRKGNAILCPYLNDSGAKRWSCPRCARVSSNNPLKESAVASSNTEKINKEGFEDLRAYSQQLFERDFFEPN